MPRHAVVTGASRGIGAAIVEALAADGVRVTGMSRASGVDVTKPTAVAEAFVRARHTHGPIDILVNNAGAVESAPYLKVTDEHWRSCFALNVDGAHYCTRAALPDMLARGWGRIVNIASVAGLRGYPYVAAYVAAKHALVGLTRSLAAEVHGHGVTINAVCPGYTDTDLVRNAAGTILARTGRAVDETRAQFAQANPLGRLVRPDEVAALVARLCRDESAGVNGQALTVE